MVDWLEIAQTSGYGDTQILMTALPNSSVGERTTSLLLSGNTKSKVINVIQEEEDYSMRYFTLSIRNPGYIYWKGNQAISVDYRINGGEWTTITSSQYNPPRITAETADEIEFRGINQSYRYSNFSGSTASFDVYGNIMSLVYGDNFIDTYTLQTYDAFSGFLRDTSVIEAHNLVLPATALTSNCYTRMFSGCTSLLSTPALPAMNLEAACYWGMFQGCIGLKATPDLPATGLAESCYEYMFDGCINLTRLPNILPAMTLAPRCYENMFRFCNLFTIAPELPAETLVTGCYNYMFQDCTFLNYVKCLATNPASSYTQSWLGQVATEGTFVKAVGSTWESGANGIPYNWTVEEV